MRMKIRSANGEIPFQQPNRATQLTNRPTDRHKKREPKLDSLSQNNSLTRNYLCFGAFAVGAPGGAAGAGIGFVSTNSTSKSKGEFGGMPGRPWGP